LAFLEAPRLWVCPEKEGNLLNTDLSILPDLSIHSLDRTVARVSSALSISPRPDSSNRGGWHSFFSQAVGTPEVYTTGGVLDSGPGAITGLIVDFYV